MERVAHLESLFFSCLSDSSKQVLLVEKSHPSLEGPRKGEPLPYSPQMGPIWKQTPISRTLLYISFRVPSKGAPLPGFPHSATIEMLCFQSPPSSVSQESLVNELLPGATYIGPLWRELPISRAFFYMFLEFLNKSFSDRKISHFSQSPWQRNVTTMFPKMGSYGSRRPFPEPYLTYPSRSPLKESSSRFLSQSSHTHTHTHTHRCSISTALLHLFFKVPGTWAPSRFPTGAPM